MTDNENTIQNALTSLSTSQYNSGTNTDAGLKKAKSMFSSSKTSQKFIILLSDGVPNHAVGVSISAGGWFGPSEEEKMEDVIKETKKTIQSMKNSNINLITMLTGLGDLSEEDNTTLQAVFGTIENPTEGLLYNINDTDIEKIIKEQIYTEVLEKVQNPINTVKIVDYFPEDITENFEFSYVGNASLGNVSETIDTEKKTIEWNIGTLKGDEVATLKYKLKIKDMKNTNLLNKAISTNEKVVLTYKDKDSKDYKVELTSSPKIQLSEVKEELTATVSYDPTSTTTGKVTATIKTNKKVNKVDGWTLSDDGKTLTKAYSANATETVHLVDLDGMTKDIGISITNIIKEQQPQKQQEQVKNDENTSGVPTRLPQTGINVIATIISILGILFIAIIMYKKYNSYKDIK